MLVLRHAQSTWNADGRWQGWADPPLSDEGVRQAHVGGSQLLEALSGAWDAQRFSSDLLRARRTAEILGQSAGLTSPLQIDDRLRERDVGAWSGSTRAEIESIWPAELARWDAGELTAPPGG
ncbi:MAG: histidine phosphatase family protein [Acidimicrobiales bacterium]